ncbi:UvrD-helicase domain-containing protein [Streptomyces thioluteus]|uniref:UvrD-helicase domain-containing protein n=1 Tax=Streptomyces thioluteus TaxID=66431 RepID=UPI0031F0C0B6
MTPADAHHPLPQVPETADAVLDGLDPEQRAGRDGARRAVCVLAGAGTGKTRAITHRIAFGVRSGLLQPASVLAVTFTQPRGGRVCAAGSPAGRRRPSRRTFHSRPAPAPVLLAQGRRRRAAPAVERKVQLVAEAAARCRSASTAASCADTTAEIEWAKSPRPSPRSIRRRRPLRPRGPPRHRRDRQGLRRLRAAQALSAE